MTDWDDLSASDKCDVLREDIKRLAKGMTLNELRAADLATTVQELEGRVKLIELRLAPSPDRTD